MFLAHLKTTATTATTTATAPASSQPATAPVPAESWRKVETSIEPEPATVPASSQPATAPVPVVIVKPATVPASSQPATAPVPVVVEPVRIESVETLQPLRGKTRAGDFVHKTQTMDSRFRNVSTGWTNRLNDGTGNLMDFETAIETIERNRGKAVDLLADYSEFRAVATADGFGLEHRKTGRIYSLSETALDQFAERSGIGVTLPRRLVAGDSADRETLAIVAGNGLRKIAEKSALIRARENGSIRAFLSQEYRVIDHVWFLETLRRIVPGGLVSHFESDDDFDSVRFNILIPDSLRAETDSEYGGMLACGNGETGHSRLRSMPAIFRAICMNGCIWDRVDGIGFVNQVHRGEIDLNQLERAIRDNLNRQIPLLNSGIEQMLSTRGICCAIEPVPAIGATLQALNCPGITRATADSVVEWFAEQRTESGRISAFDLVQGITRAAREQSAELRETMERAAGTAVYWPGERWETVFRTAAQLTARELNRIFATAAA